jgi:hypothetical protein
MVDAAPALAVRTDQKSEQREYRLPSASQHEGGSLWTSELRRETSVGGLPQKILTVEPRQLVLVVPVLHG